MRLRAISSALAVTAALVRVRAGVPPEAVSATPAQTVELPATFAVKDTNSSQAPCYSDGASYTIKGHITAPGGALPAVPAPSIAVYLYGYEGGEWNWDLKGVPGYDYAAEMAKRGHVSLTLDELGYGQSGRPRDGNLDLPGRAGRYRPSDRR